MIHSAAEVAGPAAEPARSEITAGLPATPGGEASVRAHAGATHQSSAAMQSLPPQAPRTPSTPCRSSAPGSSAALSLTTASQATNGTSKEAHAQAPQQVQRRVENGPPPGPRLHKMMEIQSFLLVYRTKDSEAFAQACLLLYDEKFRRTKKTQPPAPQQVINLDPDPEDISLLSVEIPKIDAPLFKGREAIIEAVKNRWKRYQDGFGRPVTRKSEDGDNYVIWENRREKRLLRTAFCQRFVELLDRSQELSEVLADVLRFLWHYLFVDSCSGAIINHGIEFPRVPLMAMFLSALLNESKDIKKCVLVICPPSTVHLWQETVCSFDELQAKYMAFDSFVDDISRWQKHGGVLVCSSQTYLRIVQLDPCSNRTAALRALCRPGPDIIVLDEAFMVYTYSSVMQGYLNRTETTSRLALTSLPVNGNLLRYWCILNWASPQLLGTHEEYWEVYIKNLGMNLQEDQSGEETRRVKLIARQLFRTLEHVTFTITARTRVSMLEERGCKLQEGTIRMKMAGNHAAIYKHIAQFLGKCVSQSKISAYCAMHVLLVAATSVVALQKLLFRGGRDDGSELGEQAERTRRPLRLLYQQIQTLCTEVSTTKMEMMKAIGMRCLQAEEKLAVFTCYPEVQEDAWQVLRASLREDVARRVFNLDLTRSQGENQKCVEQFNRSSSGAILLVPYGPLAECCEGSGWGCINATRVVVLDTAWQASCASQIVERVLNFGDSSARVIRFYRLLSSETAEESLRDEIIPTWSSPLVARVDPKFISEMVDLERDERGVSLEEVRRNIEQDESALDDGYISVFGQNNGESPEFRVEATPNQHVTWCEISDRTLAIRNEHEAQNAAREVALERIAYAKTLSDVLSALEEAVCNRNAYRLWNKTRIMSARNILDEYSDPVEAGSSLMTHWRGYFLTYEQEAAKRVAVKKKEEKGEIDVVNVDEEDQWSGGDGRVEASRKRALPGGGFDSDRADRARQRRYEPDMWHRSRLRG